MGSMSFRNYLFIAVGVGAMCYLLGLVASGIFAEQLNLLRFSAINAGLSPVIAQVIVDPIIWAFSGDVVGAIVAGLLWPLSLFWIVFVVFMIIFAVIGGGIGTVRQETGFGD